jgi:hypothetical protein
MESDCKAFVAWHVALFESPETLVLRRVMLELSSLASEL